ncbi:cytoplasmic polyadenylation element-binding protein 2 isoform X2 [Lutzomyia longipalpis]|uniref:cytoplasmic polyadenylation element-binding protein 2 isoform X2 n=1 Tax=Lutzomyia longipalpis TaxID=7200 RepID=UPI002483A8D3|nr:cytoplasmic polyadenylation element-binding protein 2 isoform X2 [Lutzomyia longipalpis]XP_055677447.1 cytoplasmic polyadenylation element-binding protein 2 isoform X2 [Lutzomyia longipalpis]XP_055677448.1 cytoplasmic polyadenylation element-binding protein 2 isoform X2 [Lutzomyia longipalpis]
MPTSTTTMSSAQHSGEESSILITSSAVVSSPVTTVESNIGSIPNVLQDDMTQHQDTTNTNPLSVSPTPGVVLDESTTPSISLLNGGTLRSSNIITTSSGNSTHSNSSMMSGSGNSVMNFTSHQQQGVNDESSSNLWPTGAEDIAVPSTHISVNGYSSGFQNYSAAPLFNGGVSVAVAPNHQHPRRAITASHTGNGSGSNIVSGYSQHHGLSPTAIGRQSSMQHQQSNMSGGQQQNHHQNLFKNSYPAWSNPPPSIAWPLQGNQNHQATLGAWNRGRSVPNLNPLSTGGIQQSRKPTSPNPPCHSPFGSLINSGAQGGMGGQNSSISPMKYRRSTSFPGKVSVGPLEISNIDDTRDTFMAYQERGLGNGLDMRTLEHCLSDIMRGVTDCGSSEHFKGFQGSNINSLQSMAQLHGKPFFQGIDDHIPEEAGGFVDNSVMPLNSPTRSSPHSQNSESVERFSRKVFVGGLPPDIDEDEITSSFRRFGPLVVDWPHKAESKSYFPPKGYAFLLFQDESSVQQLIEACITDEDKLYLCVSSPTIKDKPVQIRPWRLSDADFVLNASMPLDPRKTVFVGGVPRPLKAFELAMIMDRLYGGVCYAGIDTDPELKYPKGAGRVAFANQQSYIAAISARFVQLQHGDIDKRVEVKPYVLDDQMCDECQGQLCGGKFAPFFCANVTCLQYYCEQCWATIHSKTGREYHKPLVKEGADRPRAVPFRWC